MDEEIFEKPALLVRIRCKDCEENLAIELCISRKDDDLYVWQEGLCNNCGNSVLVPLPKSTLLLDEQTKLMISN